MRITSKGQVTIPIEIRVRLGLLPETEVDLVVDGEGARIVRRDPSSEGVGGKDRSAAPWHRQHPDDHRRDHGSDKRVVTVSIRCEAIEELESVVPAREFRRDPLAAVAD